MNCVECYYSHDGICSLGIAHICPFNSLDEIVVNLEHLATLLLIIIDILRLKKDEL